MRTTIFLTGSILLLCLAPSALAVLPGRCASDGSNCGCPDWEASFWSGNTGAGVSTDEGAMEAGAANIYVASDWAPVVGGENLFSIWVFEESNGQEGFQRGDEWCDETNGGEIEPDCGFLCTF